MVERKNFPNQMQSNNLLLNEDIQDVIKLASHQKNLNYAFFTELSKENWLARKTVAIEFSIRPIADHYNVIQCRKRCIFGHQVIQCKT